MNGVIISVLNELTPTLIKVEILFLIRYCFELDLFISYLSNWVKRVDFVQKSYVLKSSADLPD